MSEAWIQKIKPSIISSNVSFTMQYWKTRKLLKYRNKNITSTQMCWITLRPIMDYGNTICNPKALIFAILN